MSGTFFLGRLKNNGYNDIPILFRVYIKLRNILLRKADAFVSLSKEITSEFINSGKKK